MELLIPLALAILSSVALAGIGIGADAVLDKAKENPSISSAMRWALLIPILEIALMVPGAVETPEELRPRVDTARRILLVVAVALALLLLALLVNLVHGLVYLAQSLVGAVSLALKLVIAVAALAGVLVALYWLARQ